MNEYLMNAFLIPKETDGRKDYTDALRVPGGNKASLYLKVHFGLEFSNPR